MNASRTSDRRAPIETVESDASLWERSRAGDAVAFGQLFDRHGRAIYNFCFRRTADWSAAEDLASATFLHAWRRRSEVSVQPGSELAWLYGIALNLTRRHARGLSRLIAGRRRLPPLEPVPDHADDVASRLDDARLVRSTLELVEDLRQDDQDVLFLCVWAGLSYEEAATALGVPVGTVRSRLSRARARLNARLARRSDPLLGAQQKGELDP
jgi:RNA polymerase sigma factor (sigma-70 family)